LKWHIELSPRTDERRKYEKKPSISESDKLFWADNKNRTDTKFHQQA
jgi:hypothetical protein